MNDSNSRTAVLNSKRPKLDLQQLQLAVIAADHGSFRRAAEACQIKQSSLSRAIRQLEHSLGISVFERSPGGIRPTLEGRNFLRIARSIAEQMDALVDSTRANALGHAGRLAIGFCTSLTVGNLRASLLDFKHRYPGIALMTSERSRTRLATGLRNSVLDILIMAGEAPCADCKTMSLWSERILAVLQQDHALTARDIIYWTDLRDQTVLLSQYDPGRELEDILHAKLVSPTDRPTIERHDVSRGVIKSLISMGIGISLVLESDIGANFAGLTYREVRDGAGPSRIGFSAIWRPDNENPALAQFLKLLAERYTLPS